ncbi:MAG: hypothetical protein AAF997_05105 [Myxococcota bacterium]
MPRSAVAAHIHAALLLVSATGTGNVALAEEPDPEIELLETVEEDTYPTRFAQRPLVLDPGIVRLDGRINVGGVEGSGVISALDLGVALSPVENLEVGLSTELTGALPSPPGVGLVSVLFSPDAAYGDIPVYARYRFLEGRIISAGLDLIAVLPSNSDLTVEFGIPFRIIELFGLFTSDLRAAVRYRNGDKFAGAVDNPANTTFDVRLDGASSINITDHGFLELGGGVDIVNIGGRPGAKNVVELPLFLTGGYTIRRKVLVDVFAQVGFNPLETFNAPPGRGTFNVDEDWFVNIGATIFTEPLFGKRKKK